MTVLQAGEEKVTCPHCHKLFIAVDESPPQIQVKHNGYSISDAGKPCPSCGFIQPSDGVICTHCGLHFMTGKHLAVYDPRRTRPVLLAAAFLVLAASTIAGYRYYPLYLRRAATVPTSIPPPPPSSATDEQKTRDRLAGLLDEHLPLYRIGQEADIRKQRGQIVHGVVEQLDNTMIALRPACSQTVITPVAELDALSKIRCSMDERNLFIDGKIDAYRTAKSQAGFSLDVFLVDVNRSIDRMLGAYLTDYKTSQQEKPAVDGSPEPGEQQLAALLDANYPLFKVGDMVSIHQKNGIILKGVLKLREQYGVVLDLDNGTEKQIAYAGMVKASRIRCDEAYRLDWCRKKNSGAQTTQ